MYVNTPSKKSSLKNEPFSLGLELKIQMDNGHDFQGVSNKRSRTDPTWLPLFLMDKKTPGLSRLGFLGKGRFGIEMFGTSL